MKSTFFKPQELIAPEVLALLGVEGAMRLIPATTLNALDNLRRLMGMPLVINSGSNVYCGIRPLNCPIGAAQSRHKLVVPGVTAFDIHCADYAKMDKLVTENNRMLCVVRMEDPSVTKNWRHLEFSTDLKINDLIIFKP